MVTRKRRRRARRVRKAAKYSAFARSGAARRGEADSADRLQPGAHRVRNGLGTLERGEVPATLDGVKLRAGDAAHELFMDLHRHQLVVTAANDDRRAAD